jgi:uncharacterized integral membrane protein (TIGR00697 family)
MIFAVSLIISNVVTAKTIETGIKLIGGMTISIPGAALCYAITFLMTDVIGEIWGKKEANKVVLFGFICQTIATLLIIFTQILPATNPDMQNAYNMLLGQNIIFVVGSLVAYFISQSWDVYIFHKIRDKYIAKHGSTAGGRWIWNNASTMTSQILDTVIFIGISFGLGFGWLWNNPIGLLNMFVGQYLVKFILAALDTPIFYLLTRERK